MSHQPILCIGGPRDGQRISISESMWAQSRFDVLDDEYQRMTYYIHRIADADGSTISIAAPSEVRNPIAGLIAGYSSVAIAERTESAIREVCDMIGANANQFLRTVKEIADRRARSAAVH